MISPESLQRVETKEGKILLHIAVETTVYVNDKNKATKYDLYPWLDKDNKTLKTVDRETIE